MSCWDTSERRTESLETLYGFAITWPVCCCSRDASLDRGEPPSEESLGEAPTSAENLGDLLPALLAMGSVSGKIHS
jgi:hypothetical protein